MAQHLFCALAKPEVDLFASLEKTVVLHFFMILLHRCPRTQSRYVPSSLVVQGDVRLSLPPLDLLREHTNQHGDLGKHSVSPREWTDLISVRFPYNALSFAGSA